MFSRTQPCVCYVNTYLYLYEFCILDIDTHFIKYYKKTRNTNRNKIRTKYWRSEETQFIFFNPYPIYHHCTPSSWSLKKVRLYSSLILNIDFCFHSPYFTTSCLVPYTSIFFALWKRVHRQCQKCHFRMSL